MWGPLGEPHGLGVSLVPGSGLEQSSGRGAPLISSEKCCLITFSCWPSLHSNLLSRTGQSIKRIYHQRQGLPGGASG